MNKIKKFMFILIAVMLITPIVLNLIMFLPFSITSKYLTQENWLSFWGSYLGGGIAGIGTLLTIYLTIKHYEEQTQNHYKLLKNQDNISRVNKILEAIYDRDTISGSIYCLCNFEKETIELIEKYNSIRGELLSYFTNESISIFIALLELNDDKGGRLKNSVQSFQEIPEEIREYAYSIGRYALYENFIDHVKGDSRFGHMLLKEGGGSYGMWIPMLIKFESDEIEDHYKEFYDEYFKVIPRLVKKLEYIRLSYQRHS